MKILEAINNSVPFVSTTIGAEGLEFKGSRDCEIADDPNEFAYKVLKLLRDERLQQQYVINCRKVYEDKYSESVLSQKRLEILNKIIN